jgi:hypothetical protein
LVFGDFQRVAVLSGQGLYTCDVTVQNVTNKVMPPSVFTVYVTDKNHLRIADSLLRLPEVHPKHAARSQLQFTSTGTPARLSLVGGRIVPMKIISVPSGATLKVDGQDAGVTPATVKLTVGTHTLDLAKQGYAPGTTPLEITSDELPGGSVTIELGGLSRDTVELRDGTVLLGDLISMSMTAVVVRVDGIDQTYERNRVKRILLVAREVTQQPAIIQPAPSQPQK